MLTSVFKRLARVRRTADADAHTGHLAVEENGRWIPIDLPTELLSEYASSLGDALDSSIATCSEERRNDLRAQHLAILIEELLDSDLENSLTAIHLIRRADGVIELVGQRGAPLTLTEALPPLHVEKDAYWSSHP